MHLDDAARTRAEPDLVQRLRGRDPGALEALYAEHASHVYGLALRVLQDSDEAQEVTQDVFVYAWQRAAAYDAARGSLGAWLVTLARSRSIDRLRARRSRARRLEGLATEAHAASAHVPDASAGMLRDETRTRVLAALACLPEEQRRALEIAYFEGLSHSEIAARLATPLGTVKTRIRQGMIRMRAELGER